MSHFYGTLKGQAKTTATRRGSKPSGITVTARSWVNGVKVCLSSLDAHTDEFTIYLDKGSNSQENVMILATFAVDSETGEIKHCHLSNNPAVKRYYKKQKE